MNEFEQAEAAQELRNNFRHYADMAVQYGHVDKGWVNGKLAALGIQPLGGKAEYRMNVAITGNYGWRCKASNRAEAMEQFRRNVARVAGAGKITADGSYDNVYDLEIVGEPVFHSGPEDPEVADASAFTLDGLKTAMRDVLKEGVAQQGWGHSYAVNAAESLGLESLPSLVSKTVLVPVVGTHRVTVQAFADDDDNAVQARVHATLSGGKTIAVEADEIGDATVAADPFPKNEIVF